MNPASEQREGPALERAESTPLLRAGLYWPGMAVAGRDDIERAWVGDGPVVPIVFDCALVPSGNTAWVDALVEALSAVRLRPLPVFVQSLKDSEAPALLTILAAHPLAVILNATGFSVTDARADDPLAADCPVLQVVFANTDHGSWRPGTRGLGPRDLAMIVALSEIDGRVLSRALPFKAPRRRDTETQADPADYHPIAGGAALIADLARNWARLQAKPAAERRIAVMLANLPNRDGRAGDGIGHDALQSAIALFAALRGAGYRLGDMPEDASALMARLLAGPSNARPSAAEDESLAFNEYSAFFAALPATLQRQVTTQWGAAERDPFYRPGRLDCGRIAISGFRAGNVAVLIQPSRGPARDPQTTHPDPAPAPSHAHLATCAWVTDAFRADVVIRLSGHGTLEWLPGEGFLESVLGPLPDP